MKIDFSTKMKELDGSQPEGSPTLGNVCVTALMTMNDDDRSMSGRHKFDLALLAQKVVGEAVLDISAEEAALLKDRIGKICTPIIVLNAWAILDG